ncbi:MAG: hypothetical protein K0U45_04500 [Alphaproteobacteria bacterium]|nr:hypothetical protein [Alphaproteobacteria bacterium]
MLISIYQFIDTYFWLLLILFTYYFIIQPSLVKILGYKLQELETEWSCFVRDNDVDSSNPIYDEISDLIGKNIIAQKKITFVRHFLLLISILRDEKKIKQIKKFANKIEKLDIKQKEKIDCIVKEAHRVKIKTIWVNSPIWMLSLSILFFVGMKVLKLLIVMGNQWRVVKTKPREFFGKRGKLVAFLSSMVLSLTPVSLSHANNKEISKIVESQQHIILLQK